MTDRSQQSTAQGIARYRSMLQRLQPLGLAWTRNPESVLGRLYAGFAVEQLRVERRGEDLLAELDPRTTVEMLVDWEHVTGLPDACTGPLASTSARRAAIVARLGELGGQSRAYFISLAAALGYTITITEFDAFTVGMTVGQPLNGADWQFAWRVQAPEVSVRTFEVGTGVAGDPLRDWGNDLLECAIERAKPAHTVVHFAYSS